MIDTENGDVFYASLNKSTKFSFQKKMYLSPKQFNLSMIHCYFISPLAMQLNNEFQLKLELVFFVSKY